MTGADGQVGRALRRHLPAARFLGRPELDVTDRAAVMRTLGGAALVVHCAAMTAVDRCEREPDRAMAVNAGGSEHVAAAAERVIALSTDYVFAGEGEGEHREDDPTGPRSVYGRSKLAGERAVLAAGPNLVVRTSWVFGDGANFIRSIVAADRRGAALRVVADQRGRPTAAAGLARALAHLAGRGHAGVLHVAGDGEPCSWADLAELVVGHPVQRITSEEWAAQAPRPRNGVLCLDRARALGVPLTDWRTSVGSYLEELE